MNEGGSKEKRNAAARDRGKSLIWLGKLRVDQQETF